MSTRWLLTTYHSPRAGGRAWRGRSAAERAWRAHCVVRRCRRARPSARRRRWRSPVGRSRRIARVQPIRLLASVWSAPTSGAATLTVACSAWTPDPNPNQVEESPIPKQAEAEEGAVWREWAVIEAMECSRAVMSSSLSSRLAHRRLVQHALRAPGALERFLPPPSDAGRVRNGTGRATTSDAERLRAVIPEQWYLGHRRELEEVGGSSE